MKLEGGAKISLITSCRILVKSCAGLLIFRNAFGSMRFEVARRIIARDFLAIAGVMDLHT